jgi:uncharacterized membrane protein YqjE
MDPNDRSISAVIRDIVQNIQDIVRAELRLAKKEIGSEVAKAKTAAALLGVGAVCALFGVLFALVAAVLGLARIVADWQAALIVSALTAVVAIFFILSGRKQLEAIRTVPPRTAETVKENVQWIKQHTK